MSSRESLAMELNQNLDLMRLGYEEIKAARVYKEYFFEQAQLRESFYMWTLPLTLNQYQFHFQLFIKPLSFVSFEYYYPLPVPVTIENCFI